ncbi:hypothetical protein HS088_TW06G01376 [Tripterygium wilfordii]|uniref:Uncharacterized protein n=1 Tax=Tripterygium wilfordii TaxID=458696 RepID=A0A7J7DLF5_TRIWF|nr:UPF0496 protein At1g20180-like isoform X1 [Tripterygium wilfordii]KAF5747195.1 hypothetical protein HS088_TW06G01376 [Tripterygium wilfordii]
MSHIRKLVWSKLRSSFKGSGSGRSREKLVGSLESKLTVNEEYVQAFRTKSYIEMWGKVQGQIRKTSVDGIDGLSTSSPHPFYQHLSECVLEPRQETLIEMIKNSKFHRLLIDYFEASLEACNVCELLLRSIHQARTNHRRIKKVVKLCRKAEESSKTDDSSSQVLSQMVTESIVRELTAFALLKNPLSYISPVQFRKIHDNDLQLLHRLTSKEKKMRRRVKLNRICKKIGGFSLIFADIALLIALIVLSLHSIIGIVAAPGLIACYLSSLKSVKNKVVCDQRSKTSLLECFAAQLDMAAKGIFILINDFDTMSRLARRLHDEIEHCRDVADLCVKNGKGEILKEVVREFQIHQSCFLEQSQELEEHVYLCFNTINRSRRLVIQEVMVAQQ